MCYNSKYRKSYPLLTEMVDEMFPAFKEKEEDFGKEEQDERFNDYNFWRPSIPYAENIVEGSEIEQYFK